MELIWNGQEEKRESYQQSYEQGDELWQPGTFGGMLASGRNKGACPLVAGGGWGTKMIIQPKK